MNILQDLIKAKTDKAIAALNSAIAKTFPNSKGMISQKSTTYTMNSAFESTPELVEKAHAGVQISTPFLANHVDVELVDAEEGKFLGISDDGQPFSTKQELDDAEIDSTFTEDRYYKTEAVCARIVTPYSFLVRWNHIANFLALVMSALRISRGNGYAMLGFYGQMRKDNVLAQNDKLGRRIATGWLQRLINEDPGQVKGIILAGGDDGSDTSNRRGYTVDPINIGTETGTKGTGSAYTTTAAGFAIGTTSIPLITGTGTILAGDEIQFAGDDTRYVVETGISAPGTIVLASGLLKAIPAAATAVTIVTETVADHISLQMPVLQAINKLIPVEYQENLRIIVGIGIYTHLTEKMVQIVEASSEGISEANALAEYAMNLNIAGYPVVLDKKAPANMILITRTAASSSSWADRALAAVNGMMSNPLLSNSNLVLLRHSLSWKGMVNMYWKSKIVDFTWESIFFGLRHPKAAVLFHPDAIRFFDGTSYKAAGTQWQLTKLDEPLADR